MAFVTITSSQTDAKSPIDVQLMDVGLNQNLDDHEARILALESGGGSGGSSDPSQDPRYGSVLAGFQTNEAKFWRLRYAIPQGVINNGEKLNNIEGFDPGGEDQSRFMYGNEQINWTYDTLSNYYLGLSLLIPDGKTMSFKVKKGENFFGLGMLKHSSGSDTVRVYIDGQSITSFGGITNEFGSSRADTFSSVAAVNLFQHVEWFFGLDGEEHVISVFNDDSGANSFTFNFIEVGYASKPGTHAVDLDLKVNAGRVNVRGSAVTTAETSVTFDATESAGRTDALVVDTAGSVTVLKGIEPAMTQTLPEVAMAFSGALTTFKVKNAKYFPSSGFLVVSHPGGGHYLCSYTGKTESTIAQHSFDGVLWQSKPKDDYTPENNFTSGSAGDPTGSINVNLWAAGGHSITSSNNKLDFKITLNGTQTTHAATITNGLYSADLMPLGRAIVNAMKAVKPLSSGEYFAEYNADAQRWTIGVKGSEVTELQLLFSTGSNVANSIHTTLGYSTTDLTGKNSYLAQSEKQSLAHRVFQADKSLMTANDPRIQYNFVDGALSSTTLTYIKERLGLGYVRTVSSATPIIKIHPDEDACGLSFTFNMNDGGSMIVAQVDYGQQIYAVRTEFSSDAINHTQLLTGFLSFPRGSKVISLWQLSDAPWEITDNTNNINFVGARQYFTKPKVEALTTTQSIIKNFDIAPKQFFITKYESSYSPQASFDNIDTITYNGTWTNSAGDWFGGDYNTTTTLNDYVDVTFTLTGNGGGIGVSQGFDSGAYSRLVSYYLVSGASGSETNTLIQNNYLRWAMGTATSGNRFQILGLPSGQYTLRVKNLDSGNTLLIDGYSIIDTVAPDRGQTVTDVTNTGQAVSYPLNSVKFNFYVDSSHKTPAWLFRSGYNQGKAYLDYQATTVSEIITLDDEANVKTHNLYFSDNQFTNDADEIRSFYFAKSVFLMPGANDTAAFSATVNPVIDGINHANTFSNRVQTKGGAGPTSVRDYYPLFNDHFLRYGTSMTNSTTLPLTNTRGFKAGHTVILEADSQPTLKRVINTVTAGTNITFTEAVPNHTNYTTANNVRAKAYGFHVIKFENDTADEFAVSAICFEPMDIQASNHEQRRLSTNKIGEVATLTFIGVANGDDLYYPVFSDGRPATYIETSIDIMAISSGTATYSINFDLKNITVSAGTLDIKLTAVRKY